MNLPLLSPISLLAEAEPVTTFTVASTLNLYHPATVNAYSSLWDNTWMLGILLKERFRASKTLAMSLQIWRGLHACGLK